MITTQALVEALRTSGLLAGTSYSHPILTLHVVSKDFDETDYDGNSEIISKATGLTRSDILDASSRPLVSLAYYAQSSDLPPLKESVADHWLAVLQGSPLTKDEASYEHSPRCIHFYGYKGGQARSTTLAMVAKRLADQGLDVLLVDADIEAPSLHLLFNSAVPRLSASLMGLCEAHINPTPIAAFAGRAGGHVDLIGCRPTGAEHDLDFQAFALSTAIDPMVLRRGFDRLRNIAETSQRWDYVFVDHRTGTAPSVIPIISAWPGSTVMSLRPDSLSTPATTVARTLLSAYPAYPGAFVSFSLDPEARRDQHSSQDEKLKEIFLSILSDALKTCATEDANIDPLSLEHSYIYWYFDRAFLDEHAPDFERLSKDNQDSISDLIQILGIDISAKKAAKIDSIQSITPPRVPSGATDAGWFIETREIAKLMQASSAFSYIFGRKGTGKTRIYREMHKRNKGIPLLAAADYKEGGIRAQSVSAQDLLRLSGNDFEQFWWKLIHLNLSAGGTQALDEKAQENMISAQAPTTIDARTIYSLASKIVSPVMFLIDGVETAVSSKDTKQLVEALFRVLSTIQNDPSINEKIQFKLFIRPDLSVGIQNIEQQTAGRKLELRWDEASIFNYMLAEIERKTWFNSHFSTACAEISKNQSLIREGLLDRDSYERILLQIFPTKIRRNNLLTITFLRTYFSDAVSDSTDKRSSFYPRVVGSFLDHVEKMCASDPSNALDFEGRVSHSIIVEAFTKATDEFIDEIKQELYFALDLNPDNHRNTLLVDDLIASLGGLQTPFSLDQCIEKLQVKLGLSAVNDRALRDALRQMKDMGIFETHPLDPSKWRAGRLFKEALRMKYVR
jgi:Mrp family chromosome partitioning ATPase